MQKRHSYHVVDQYESQPYHFGDLHKCQSYRVVDQQKRHSYPVVDQQKRHSYHVEDQQKRHSYHVGDLDESETELDDDFLGGVEDGSGVHVVVLQQGREQALLIRNGVLLFCPVPALPAIFGVWTRTKNKQKKSALVTAKRGRRVETLTMSDIWVRVKPNLTVTFSEAL